MHMWVGMHAHAHGGSYTIPATRIRMHARMRSGWLAPKWQATFGPTRDTISALSLRLSAAVGSLRSMEGGAVDEGGGGSGTLRVRVGVGVRVRVRVREVGGGEGEGER